MDNSSNKRIVFFISDRSGKTSELIGQSLLSQFDSVEFEIKTYSFVTSVEDVTSVAEEISKQLSLTSQKPLVFSTLVDPKLHRIIESTNACVIGLFSNFIAPLEETLGIESSHTIGKPHEEYDETSYKKRIDAIDFTMKNDDGININQFSEADVILIGVSRSGKTPTCLYLALNFSLRAANYPLTDDDLQYEDLPEFLRLHKDKIIGLTIKPEHLSAIRQQRRPESEYSSLVKCKSEVIEAEAMMRKAGIFMIESTSMSIEEIAINIIKEKHLYH